LTLLGTLRETREMKYYMVIILNKAYNLVNLTRIAKNLLLFPLEAVFITIILGALIKPLKSIGVIDNKQEFIKMQKNDYIFIAVLFVISVALVLFYVFFLKDFISAHNIKIW